MEITKAELETIVAGAVQKAMGASQNAANPPQNTEGAAITTNDVQKAAGGCEGAEEPITAETIEKMVISTSISSCSSDFSMNVPRF